MLIVVAIMALIASGVAVGVFKYWIGAQESAAKTSARSLRAAVKTWWVTHDSSTCPQPGELVSDGTLDKDSAARDPWGGEWRIECAGDDVTISSSGRDHKAGTEDDIRVLAGATAVLPALRLKLRSSGIPLLGDPRHQQKQVEYCSCVHE